MQLWTDKTFTEFAVSLNEFGYVAVSDAKAVYSEIIAELICIDGHCRDWRRTLTEWVNCYLRNVNLDESISNYKQFSPPNVSSRGLVSLHKRHSYLVSQFSSAEHFLKCETCNLKYVIAEEYKEHQAIWH